MMARGDFNHLQVLKGKNMNKDALIKKMLCTGITIHFMKTYVSRYTLIESKHSTRKSNCVMDEPIMENPCSYESVEKVQSCIRKAGERSSS